MSWEANQKYSAASIEEYGLSETATGTPYVWVTFITAGCDGAITWKGWLTSKARAMTYKNLMKMGWNESLDGMTLNTEKDFEIETTLEEWTGKDGTAKSKITVKWVNDPAERKGSSLKPERLHLINQSLKADLAAIKAEEKGKTRMPPMAKEATTVEDLPF